MCVALKSKLLITVSSMIKSFFLAQGMHFGSDLFVACCSSSTLTRSHNFNQACGKKTCPVCLSWWSLERIRKTNMWKSRVKRGYLISPTGNLLRMLICMIFLMWSKEDFIRSKTRPIFDINGKPCEHSRSLISSDCLNWWYLGMDWNCISWLIRKLGHCSDPWKKFEHSRG